MHQKYIELIQSSIISQFFTPSELASIFSMELGKITSHGKNSIIYYEEDPCEYYDIILFGSIRLLQMDSHGNHRILNTFTQNDLLSGSFIYASNPSYPVTYVADTDVILLSLSKLFLFELLHKNRDFAMFFLRTNSDNTLSLIQNINKTYKKTIRELLMDYLESQVKIQRSKEIILPCTKTKLAELFNVHRTSISREFTNLQEEGLLEIKGKTIHLLW